MGRGFGDLLMEEIAEKIADLQTHFNELLDFHNRAIDELTCGKLAAEKWKEGMDKLIDLVREKQEVKP